MATLEEQIQLLETMLRPCVKHNNPAHIEIDMQGEFILASECGCWVRTNEFDSLAEAVAWWNERPYVDSLMEDYIREVTLAEASKKVMGVAVTTMEQLAKVVVEMGDKRSIDILALSRVVRLSKAALETVQAYRELEQAREQIRMHVRETAATGPTNIIDKSHGDKSHGDHNAA